MLVRELARNGSVPSPVATPAGRELDAANEVDAFEGLSDREAELLLSEKLRALEKDLRW